MCNVLCNFLIKIESTWKREIKEQIPQLTLLCCGRTARSSHRRCSIKKAVLKNFAISTGSTCAGVFFKKVAGLKAPTHVFSCIYCGIFKTICFEKHLRTAAFFTVSMVQNKFWNGPKGSRSRLYDGVRLQGLQRLHFFCF